MSTLVVMSVQTGVAVVPVFLNKLNTNVFSSKGPSYLSVVVGAFVVVPPVNPLFVNEIFVLSNTVASEPSISVFGIAPFVPLTAEVVVRPTRNVLSASTVEAVIVIG